MTEKELLYFEDAIGHEKNIIKIIEENKKEVDDERISNFFLNQIEIHKENINNLTKYLKEMANE